jgi:hypothetical protein
VFDIYSEAQLDAFQPKLEADAASLPANNKRARVLLTLHAKMGNMPASFTGVSEKERRLLDHVENFRKQVRGCRSSTVRKRVGVCENFHLARAFRCLPASSVGSCTELQPLLVKGWCNNEATILHDSLWHKSFGQQLIL